MAVEDTNPIPTYGNSRQCSNAVMQPGGQIKNLCKWSHLVVKFATNACGAIWWSNLKLMQVAPSRGQFCNLFKWRHLVVKFATNASGAIWLTNASGILSSWRDNSSFRCYTLGPLCLWQCFLNQCERLPGEAMQVASAPFC